MSGPDSERIGGLTLKVKPCRKFETVRECPAWLPSLDDIAGLARIMLPTQRLPGSSAPRFYAARVLIVSKVGSQAISSRGLASSSLTVLPRENLKMAVFGVVSTSPFLSSQEFPSDSRLPQGLREAVFSASPLSNAELVKRPALIGLPRPRRRHPIHESARRS